MADLLEYLKKATLDGGSDIFFISGAQVSYKLDGVLVPMENGRLMPNQAEELLTGIYELAERDIAPFMKSGDDDFSFAVPGMARFRVNAYRQRGSLAAVIRVVPFSIPDYRALHIPEQIMELSQLGSGLVLFTGVAGCGKSTTQACLIDRINQIRACHIVTLEDPIEYLHRNQKSIVSQREIAIDTQDYLSALRACVRQAPDVILLGEIRDPETIHTAITAAETGHMVIATLHTKGAVNAIDRIIDSFPSTQQQQIRVQLATVLKTVVSQQLLPDVDGGSVPAFEVLQATSAVRSLVRDNKNHQLANVIASGAREGMIAMDQSILALYRAGKITADTALHYADHPEQVSRNLR